MFSPEEIRAFLERSSPSMLGVVGTIRADGSPHVVPVWYRYDGEAVLIWTAEDRVWVRNLTRDSRAAFSVQEEQLPFSAVVMRGRAKVHTSDGADVDAEIRRITERYVAPEEVESYISQFPDLRTIVTIRPEKITAWGRGY
ncbi:MAG: PPOX class F420-dependent oxidoreductase [Chloroflexota bacterium]